jgi:hypothetical protein
VSSRRLAIDVSATTAGAPAALRVAIKPDHLVLRVGAARPVRLTATASARAADEVETGVLVVRPRGGEALRVPWAVTFAAPPRALLAAAVLAPATFAPSDVRPATLRVQVGRVGTARGLQVRPASRLDVLLYTASGNYIGLLARVRDLLPGTYSFAVTGRRPGAAPLAPGRYELRLVAWPTVPGAPTRAKVRFRVE